MRGPAWWRYLRAGVTGYCWVRCPICGRMFAGYEDPLGNLWLAGDAQSRTGQLTCPLCPGDHYAPAYHGFRTEPA